MLARVENRGVKARLAVLRRLRGEGVPEKIRIAFRGANLARDPADPPFAPVEGERAIFCLEPYQDSRGDRVGSDLYQPAIGYRSRIPLPAEGAEALIDAAVRIVHFQDRPDRGAAEAELATWLFGPNPWLIDVALSQAARFALAGPDWIPGLLRLARDVNPRRRLWALQAIGSALARGRLAPRRGLAPRPSLAEQEDEHVRACRELIVRLARTDPAPEVRAEAVRNLGALRLPGAEALLEAIAEEDEEQTVRYEAAAALWLIRGGKGGAPAPGSR